MTLTVGSLFAGIGGFDLGFERAGMTTAWQVEMDPYCRAVLARHFPHAARHEDVRHVGAANLASVDVICGGFPCQDLSVAGKGAGLDGARSGLWSEYVRIVRELRPRYVVVENVSALLGRGLGTVLGDLAACGYDAEWDCIPASAVGAPQQRDRLWIVAYVPDAAGFDGAARSGLGAGGSWRPSPPVGGLLSRPLASEWDASRPWAAGEPDVLRTAHGVPEALDRLKALGNALVPQVAEWIGERIMSYEMPQEVAA
jgi:DNA (cytosine-5)-methyltransferase 1